MDCFDKTRICYNFKGNILELESCDCIRDKGDATLSHRTIPGVHVDHAFRSEHKVCTLPGLTLV